MTTEPRVPVQALCPNCGFDRQQRMAYANNCPLRDELMRTYCPYYDPPRKERS